MAEWMAAVKDLLTCAVCLETFKEPCTLGCNHNFCSDCLHDYWTKNKTRDCPVCRRKSSKEFVIVNFVLKELCISFTEKQTSEGRAAVCASHPQVPSLFCKDEARLLCPVCEFSQHRDHTVVLLEEVEKELKEQQRSQLQSLKKQKAEAQTLERAYRVTQQHAHRQAELCERHIRAEFDRLHRFLKEEEELQLSVLREEQSRQAQSMNSELGSLMDRLASLDQNIQELQKQLEKKAEDFILSYSPALSNNPPEPLPPVGPGLLMNVAKVLGNLGFRVWRKMREMVQYSPVILDPNTANPQLRLSDNLTSLAWADARLQVPDNPERFYKYPLVLGSEGFSSGKHQWDVEVGDITDWLQGVAKESVNRKTEEKSGFWCLGLCTGKYITGSGTLELKQQPQEIQVQLDCDNGTVSFFDSSDMSLIFTYKDIPKDKLFPCFSAGPTLPESQTKSIKIFARSNPGPNKD